MLPRDRRGGTLRGEGTVLKIDQVIILARHGRPVPGFKVSQRRAQKLLLFFFFFFVFPPCKLTVSLSVVTACLGANRK